jgi:hypothetical protein
LTGEDLIASSMRLIGAIATGESPSAAEASDGLSALNLLLDSWSTESLLIITKIREEFPLVVGQKIYTWGIGGDFNSERPQQVENALIQPPNNNPVLEIPMEILNKDQYAVTALKNLQSSFPLSVYNDGNYPYSNISVWPVPAAACIIVFYSWKPLGQLSTLQTAIEFPPGYLRALRYNLAVELAPEFGRPLPPEVADIAAQSKAAIKRMNTEPLYMQVDSAITSSPAVYDWRSDGYNR